MHLPEMARNVLIAFPCGQGQIVSDRPNDGHDNSVFTWYLLQKIKAANRDIAAVLHEVSQDVYRETSQRPWIDRSLTDPFLYLHELPGLCKL